MLFFLKEDNYEPQSVIILRHVAVLSAGYGEFGTVFVNKAVRSIAVNSCWGSKSSLKISAAKSPISCKAGVRKHRFTL